MLCNSSAYLLKTLALISLTGIVCDYIQRPYIMNEICLSAQFLDKSDLKSSREKDFHRNIFHLMT